MLYLNLVLLFGSFAALFLCHDIPYLPVVVLELVAAAIAVANRDKPEIFIPLLVLMLSKVIDVILFDVFSTQHTIQFYLMGATLLDFLTFWILRNYYHHPKLWLACGCTLTPRRIQQVEFMSYVIIMNVAYNFIVLVEVYTHKWGIHEFTSAPFFYVHHQAMMMGLKFLMLLAIWSMTLDAWAVRKLIQRQTV